MSENEQLRDECAPPEIHAGRCGSAQPGEAEPQQDSVTEGAVASPSNTPPHISHSSSKPLRPLSPSAHVDWLEVGGIIDWSDARDETFFALDHAIDQAPDKNNPVPFSLAGHSILLHLRGIGSGTASRLTYRADFGPSMIAFAQREAKSRGTYNFYYKIPGTACLILGAWEVRRMFHQMIESMGGCVVDEWVRRIDLCLDLPNVDCRQKIIPDIDRHCFVGSALVREDHHVKRQSTGVTFRSGYVVLRIYDKLADVKRRTEGEYITAMVQNRWSGTIPTAATRIELQIRTGWLRQFEGMKDLKGVQERLPDIIEKLIGEGDRPFLKMTEAPVDWKNNHQSRTPTSPDWLTFRDEWQKGFGNPAQPPKRLPRGQIGSKRAFGIVKGVLSSDAARRGEVIQSLDDAKDQLQKMHEWNFATDEDWKRTWEMKARKAGTLDSTTEFPTDNDSDIDGGNPCSV